MIRDELILLVSGLTEPNRLVELRSIALAASRRAAILLAAPAKIGAGPKMAKISAERVTAITRVQTGDLVANLRRTAAPAKPGWSNS